MFDPKAVVRRLHTLRSNRQPHEAGWKECLDYSFPERGHGLNSSAISPEEAQSKKNKILDDTAQDAARTLSSSVVSGTTPSNSLWFGIDAGFANDEDEDARWLDDSARTIFENIHASNFDAAAFECALDLVAVGWFVLHIDEAKEGGYHFEQWPIAQCFISSSRLGGLVDTIYRECEMSVEQVVTTYGLYKVSNQVRQSYQNEKFDVKVKILHAIEPRKVSVVGARMSKNMPFASYHVEIETNHPLKESGYHEFPCAIPRWMLVPGSCYATGQMSSALGSIRTINDIKALELAGLDVAVSGMYVAEDDGVLNPKAIKLGPRKIIVANSVDSIKPLSSGAQFDVAFTAEERLQAQIRKAMLADQLQPQDGPAMTATEVHVRVQLIRQLLGPIFGRLQAEYLQPLIERCFGIAYRAGVLGQAPESLQDRRYTIRYINPLARAQRLEDVTAMDRLEQTLAAEASMDPTILDLYDFEEATRLRGNFLGVPNKVIRNKDAVDKLRDARKQAQQDQQQQAQMAGLQQAAGEAAIQKVA